VSFHRGSGGGVDELEMGMSPAAIGQARVVLDRVDGEQSRRTTKGKSNDHKKSH
jgi:hypothetical protein